MALAIISFPVPVSPWIKTAESTGATISTSASNARNFGLDPIKSKATIALLLECSHSSAEVIRERQSSHKALLELHLGSESKNYGVLGSTAHISVVLHHGLQQ